MPEKNYVERTHTEIAVEFGAGLGARGGASVSLNLDNQTREFSITGCINGGRTFGDIRGVVGYNEKADGGVTDSWSGSLQSKSEMFLGLGPAIKSSIELNNTKIVITESEPNKSIYTGFGGGMFIGGEGCLEVNPRGLLQELRELRDKLMDNLFGSEKDSIFDKENRAPSSTTEKPNFRDGGNSLHDAKDSFHGGRDSGLGGLADGRSLGEKKVRESNRF